jgi:DNA primase
LPPGEDPDSYVRAHGAAGFQALLDAAKPSIEFKLDPEIDRLATGFERPAAVARKAEALIRELTPREEWDRWRVYVAGRLKVNVEDLRNSRFLANPGNFSPRYAPVTGTRGAVEPLSFERDVLGIIVEDPALASEYASRIDPQRFRNPLYQRTYRLLLDNARELRTAADALAVCADDDEARELLASLGQRDRSSIVRYGDSNDRRAHLDRIVARLTQEGDAARYTELDAKLNELFASGNEIPAELVAEHSALAARLKYRDKKSS